MAVLAPCSTLLMLVLSPPATGATIRNHSAPATAAGPPAEGSAVANLDGTINTLGIFTYPDAYIGVDYSASNTGLTVYVAHSTDDVAFEQAVQSDAARASASSGQSIPIDFVTEPLSHAWGSGSGL